MASMRVIARSFLCAGVVLATFGTPPTACSAATAGEGAHLRVNEAPVTVDLGTAPPIHQGGHLILHLDDLRPAEGQAAVFRLFVNRPDATAATPNDQEGFVDEVFLVPSRSHATAPGARQPGQNLVFPLPAGVVKAGGRITVTLVPVGADTAGRLTQPGAADVTLKRPYLSVEP
jgi:hypothetical protein